MKSDKKFEGIANLTQEAVIELNERIAALDIKMIADISTGVSCQPKQLIDAINDLSIKRVTHEQIRRFSSLRVPIWGELADLFDTNIADVVYRSENGQIDKSHVLLALKKLSDTDGAFENWYEKTKSRKK